MTPSPSSEKAMEATALPTREQIALRAYAIYEQSGCQQGQCEANWLQAQRELICEAMPQLTPKSTTDDESLSTADVDEIIQNAPPRRPERHLSYAESRA